MHLPLWFAAMGHALEKSLPQPLVVRPPACVRLPCSVPAAPTIILVAIIAGSSLNVTIQPPADSGGAGEGYVMLLGVAPASR